ncbi:uncharacterized protein B0T23DRAFT_433392 [Neurospora hispaniola]|uniref:Uncharacterized protein n=1 Tax=Neurospora hispaniola TaxID=588809 RepID=A0AAJ0HYF5_9PEZI|nr:hypothetical protein B0T23DRAFT_433392 [Neurospora hispaniola]
MASFEEKPPRPSSRTSINITMPPLAFPANLVAVIRVKSAAAGCRIESTSIWRYFYFFLKDTTDILDNPDNNAHINCIRAKSDDEVEEKAWEVMFEAYDAQRGKRVSRLLTAYFPNFMDRWEALVALMRHSKAAVADLFAIHYMDRYVHNPVTELDTKLSNNYTNKMRDFNKDVKAASKFRGSVTTVDRITSIYSSVLRNAP